MLKPFFTGAELPVIHETTTIPQCGACGFYKTARHPKMRVAGSGRVPILFIGRFPEEEEDRSGKLLNSDAAVTVELAAKRAGVRLKDCWWTNALICHPGKTKKKHYEQSIDYCRPNLVKLVEELRPKVIVPLGSEAVASLMGWLWRPGEGGVHRFRGFQIPNRKLNAWVVPTWHPATLVQEKDPVLDKQFAEDMGEAADRASIRPYQKPPPEDEGYAVQIILGDVEAAVRVRSLHRAAVNYGKPVAWDFETNCLKPDGPKSEIISCSLCVGGKHTIAFPWSRRTRKAVAELLADPEVKLIGANIKFEQRWCDRFVGPVRGWWWDVNQAAHAIDNATKIRSITPVDFQAVVRLGVSEWAGKVTPYLITGKAAGGYAVNRIREVKLPDLLRYNGLDSLYEYQICRHQRRQLGLETY